MFELFLLKATCTDILKYVAAIVLSHQDSHQFFFFFYVYESYLKVA